MGKNPRGIVVNSGDTRAYVWNYVSRDISVIDLTQSPEKVIATLSSTALPQPGTQDDKVHAGRELFYTSVGVFDPAASGAAGDHGKDVEQRLGLLRGVPPQRPDGQRGVDFRFGSAPDCAVAFDLRERQIQHSNERSTGRASSIRSKASRAISATFRAA